MKKKAGNIRRRSFTLIEVVVVIVILMTLASVATVSYMKYVTQGKVTAAKNQIKEFDTALMTYNFDVKGYPTDLNGLIENTDGAETWNGPYLKTTRIPNDPWGREYVYVFPGEHGDYDIMSYGADGQEGGTGDNADIVSWE